MGTTNQCADLTHLQGNKLSLLSISSQEENSVVTCSDETRHNFQSDDYVTFSEVEVKWM